DQAQFDAGQEYARCIGLAFQIQDDILDIEGDETVFGKPIGSDAQNQKNTYPSLLGLDACKKMVRDLSQQAVDALSAFEDTGILIPLAWSLAERVK
ncbi:MAG: polyprenyl synthetase family protein, partial [Butyricicoccus sp.]